MSTMRLNINSESDFVGLITVDKFDSEEEIIERKCHQTISLSKILKDVSNGALKLGLIEVNIDFDESGEVISLEVYI